MSLVHEALQKAEREKQRKTGVWQPPAEKPAPQPVHSLGSTESAPTVVGKSTTADKHAESIGSMSVTGTFVAGRSADQAAADYAQKKPSALLPMLIVCVSLVAIVAIVFLVSLAASTIRGPGQTVHGAGEAPSTSAGAATEPKPNATAPQTVVANPPDGVTSEPVGLAAQQPSVPPAGSVEQGYRLTGVMIVPNVAPSAVINGRIVNESSYVDGATVKKIERDSVTLVDPQGKEIVLRLD